MEGERQEKGTESWIGRMVYCVTGYHLAIETLQVVAEGPVYVALVPVEHVASQHTALDDAILVSKGPLQTGDPAGLLVQGDRYFLDITRATAYRARQQAQAEAEEQARRRRAQGGAHWTRIDPELFREWFSNYDFDFGRQSRQQQQQQRTQSRSASLNLLGLAHPFTADDVKRAYKRKAQTEHPDKGGTHERFVQLQQARDEALRMASRGPGPGGRR